MITLVLVSIAVFLVYLVAGLLVILLNNRIDGKKNGTYYYSRESDILILVFWPAWALLGVLLLICLGVEYLFAGKESKKVRNAMKARRTKDSGIFSKDKLDSYAAKKSST